MMCRARLYFDRSCVIDGWSSCVEVIGVMKLLFKTTFATLVLIALVMIGMHNRDTVRFALPPVLHPIKQPAALMYVGFFAFGLFAGTVLNAGGGKKAVAAPASRPTKPDKK